MDEENNPQGISDTGRHAPSAPEEPTAVGRPAPEATGRHQAPPEAPAESGKENKAGSEATAEHSPVTEHTVRIKKQKRPKQQAEDGQKEKPEINAGKVGRFAAKTVDLTVDAAAAVVSGVIKAFATLLLIVTIAGLMFTCIFAYYVKSCLTPEIQLSLDDYKLNESSVILYQDSAGNWQDLVTLLGGQNRVWVDYDRIPHYMEEALVAIEDKRFYEHKGVDWYRTAGAFITMFATMSDNYGGSTITQQLIKNLTGKDEVTVMRKLTEIFGALELEKSYSKQEIVEWYLNAVYFGEGCYGVETAAQTYFGKDVSQLSLAECAAIIGITNKPTYYDPFYNEANNKERQETILREMYDQGYIDYDTYIAAVNEELVFAHSPETAGTQTIYTWYEEAVIDDVLNDLIEQKGISREAARQLLYNGGYKIYCCMDPDIQNIVDNVYTNLDNIPRTWGSDQQLQSGIVVMDPYDGYIVALSGGVGEKTANFLTNRATQSQRPPGSSIKPIASYGPAVELGYITPTTLVNDSADIRLSGTSWYPSNDGGENYGIVTIYQALQYSLNTVAAQIVDKLTPQVCYDFLTTRLGVTSLVPDDASYAPMALGQLTNGITVREMAQAYGAFVNDGTFTYSRTYIQVQDREGNVVLDNTARTIQAFSANTAYTMTYMMQNAVENGTGSEAALWSMPVAGKTGTSGSAKDRWFVGCTPYYVCAVWTGYDTPEYIGVSGNPAARLFKQVMSPIHDGLEYRSFTYPYIGGNTGIFGVTEEDVKTDKNKTDSGETTEDTGETDSGDGEATE